MTLVSENPVAKRRVWANARAFLPWANARECMGRGRDQKENDLLRGPAFGGRRCFSSGKEKEARSRKQQTRRRTWQCQ